MGFEEILDMECMKLPSQECKYCKGVDTCTKKLPAFGPDYPPECNFCEYNKGAWFSDYHRKYIVKCVQGRMTSVWDQLDYPDCPSFELATKREEN
jgi:hypothetical protein